MLRVSALLFILIHSSSTIEDSNFDEPYYDSYMEDFDLQETFPSGNCSVEENVCVMQNNVVDIVNNVPTLDECRTLCLDEPACKFFTHFSIDSFPFVETCALFSSCSSMTPCTKCTTEDRACIPCSAGVEGMVGTNFIQFIPNTSGEYECKEACGNHDNCTIYTYNRKSSASIPGGCFLLSGIQEPVRECKDCNTGPRNCEDRCTFSVDGGEFTNSIDPITVNKAVKILAFGTCELTVMAVGGGASGLNGGGGSGYVEFNQTTSGAGMREMQVVVGGKDEDTVVSLLDTNNEDTVFLEAKKGERSSGESTRDGGNGYSGGGGGAESSASNGGDGGTAGGNGSGSSDSRGKGGKGNPVSFDSIDGFQLSGGAAGTNISTFGGGGGGVLVNGAGPDQASVHDGQGYGAGGSGDSSAGTVGVVLFSFRNSTSN